MAFRLYRIPPPEDNVPPFGSEIVVPQVESSDIVR